MSKDSPHTPYGYRIENGKAVIDEAAATQVRELYKNYLCGLSLTNAAKEAGLGLLHSGAKRMMRNSHYLGDDFYPAIIDKESFDAVEAELSKRSTRTVNETVLENVVVQAINTLLGDKSIYQAQLQQNIAKVIREAQKNTADSIDEQLIELQRELLKKANNKEAYDEIADQIFKLREQREKCTVDTAARDAQIARINDLQDYIKKQRTNLESFDEPLVKRWLGQITVWGNHFTVELKS